MVDAAGQAMAQEGNFTPEMEPQKKQFLIPAEYLSMPGMFGLIMAALTAACRCPRGRLIDDRDLCHCCSMTIYKPGNPRLQKVICSKRHEFGASISIAILGVLLVPIFPSLEIDLFGLMVSYRQHHATN